MKVSIYTDGAARGNPDGPGGYGVVLEYVDPKGELHVKELSGGYVRTTNNRMMRGDYQKEIETLAGEKIDLAFVVLDPRQEEQFYWGFDWYMWHTDTKIVFPMHMWKQYEVQDRLIGMEVSEPYREKIMRIREMGQVFEL